MSSEPEILFERRGRVGLITLNRPQALNALTLPMIEAMQRELLGWADDPAVERVVIRGAGERAFCAGGDIRQIRDTGLRRDPQALAFFREEYRLNALVKRYPKPYIALIDGVAMGGGIGVSVHGSHRVCGERAALAMPETGIGLFPDVGATYFLPRLPGCLGTYLALTGARLGQGDALWCGVGTHAVPRARFELLVEGLAAAADIDRAIEEHSAAPPPAPIAALMPAIDRCFAAPSVEGILDALESESGEHADWAAATVSTLQSKSSVSLKIALRQMREGQHTNFEECLRIEFRIVSRVLRGKDFYEGIRAVILDKDNRPRWTHRDVRSVPESEVDRYFEPLGGDELPFL